MKGSPLLQCMGILLAAVVLAIPVWSVTRHEPPVVHVSPGDQPSEEGPLGEWSLMASAPCSVRLFRDGRAVWEGVLEGGKSRGAGIRLDPPEADWLVEAAGASGTLAVKISVLRDAETVAETTFWGEGGARGALREAPTR